LIRFQGNSVLRSDCDAQLLITVPLREAVKLSGIAFRAASDGPKTVRMFVNQPNLDFAEAESTKPNVEIVLKADDLKGVVKELKMVKFQNCTSVTFYIVDNQTDADKTNVSRISLFGSVQAGMCFYHCSPNICPLVTLYSVFLQALT
jgi:hypothetical protein